MDLNTPLAGQGEAMTGAVPSDKSLWTEFLAYWMDRRWADKAWLLPRSEETARVAEHAIETCRTLISANHLAAEAICNVAHLRQVIAFDIARAVTDTAFKVAHGTTEAACAASTTGAPRS